jgi:hypothetical protein
MCAQNGHLIPLKLRNYFETASQNSREVLLEAMEETKAEVACFSPVGC